MAGPLEGLTIVEMLGIGPCPLAGQLMADLGAEVIVVERQHGGPRLHDINSRNKKSIVLDLKTDKGVEALLRLIETVDILIEGFRPGVMERLGAGPDICLARNPRLIYGRMTGWGQQGPLASTAGHDINYLSLTGMLHPMGYADRPPSPPLNLVADYGGGTMFLIFGVLSALYERSRSGQGQVIDAAMVDGVSALTGVFRTMAHQGDWVDEREANLVDSGAPFYRAYETGDGKFISIGPIEPQFFAELVEKAGLSTDLAASRDRRKDWVEQRDAYAALFKTRTRAEWEDVFTGSDACVTPVLKPSEAPDHPHNIVRESYLKIAGLVQAAPAPRFSRTPPDSPKAAVRAGANTTEILMALGLQVNDPSE